MHPTCALQSDFCAKGCLLYGLHKKKNFPLLVQQYIPQVNLYFFFSLYPTSVTWCSIAQRSKKCNESAQEMNHGGKMARALCLFKGLKQTHSHFSETFLSVVHLLNEEFYRAMTLSAENSLTFH